MQLALSVLLVLPCVLAIPQTVEMSSPLLMSLIDQGESMENVFVAYRKVHNKAYESEMEESMRKEIFRVNVEHVKQHNMLFARGEKSYFLKVNQFSDMTHKEFLTMYTGHLHKRNPHRNASTFIEPFYTSCPDTVDWRDKNIVTKVKNQGQCGSCWSFSATGSLEGQNALKTGKLISLSEQQLVDCSGSFGNQGCNGGLMDQAFEYIKSVGGIESEDDYPYVAEEEDRCSFVKKKERAEVTGYVDIKSGSESSLKKAVCTQGPISIAIDASHPSFQQYGGGVYDEPECSSEQLDHGVLVIGYGADPSDYWLVKNSWGESWGEDGYIKMARNKENQCGVATQASYPSV